MEANLKKIVLIDDHIVVRSGLRELIQKIGPYQVTHEFDDGEALLKAFSGADFADLIVLDLSLPGISGEGVMLELNRRKNTVPVLVLTLNREEEVITRLFRAGVRGYLPKNCTANELREAMSSVFQNGYYHNEFLTLSLKANADSKQKTEQEIILAKLSPREKEFLKLVCHEDEYTYDQIADKMKLGHRTVDGHRESVFEKFGIKSKTGLVLFVLKYKLFDLL